MAAHPPTTEAPWWTFDSRAERNAFVSEHMPWHETWRGDLTVHYKDSDQAGPHRPSIAIEGSTMIWRCECAANTRWIGRHPNEIELMDDYHRHLDNDS